MIIAFIIWSLVSILFIVIAIMARSSKKPMGFWSNVKPPEVTDLNKYNRAVSNLWLAFAILFELSGIPLLFCEQNRSVAFLSAGATVALVLFIMIAYLRIEGKYRQK